jgi:rhodanese-related sulfurtransferase
MVNEVSPEELKNWIDTKRSEIQIIDIRESYEYEDGHLTPCKHIPMENVMESVNEFDDSKPLIIYCQSGKRSTPMAYMLQRECGLKNVYSLKGGFEAYQSLVS